MTTPSCRILRAEVYPHMGNWKSVPASRRDIRGSVDLELAGALLRGDTIEYKGSRTERARTQGQLRDFAIKNNKKLHTTTPKGSDTMLMWFDPA